MFVEMALTMAAYSSVQPICTTAQFQTALGGSLRGEQEIVATAIFDDYLEQTKKLRIDEGSDRDSPSKKLGSRFALANQADQLFDDLLASLGVLNNSHVWNRGIIDLRRTVLLRARQSDNPWPSTIWVDLPRIVYLQDESVIYTIDAFLIKNIDDDRTDRFDAIAAGLAGDDSACLEITSRAMERWGAYQEIIDPYTTRLHEFASYPQLDLSNRVNNLMEWIAANITDEKILTEAKQQFSLWNTIHTQQQKDVVSLVRKARTELGFDPWSRGCGHPSSSTATTIKNKLLQRSAEMVELKSSTFKLMVQQLTPEQRLLFEDGQ
ncbi:MAG TPA: hypothetical protein EYM64_01110 [Phycisphaerales bacterium]|nr:hypothetical protein [Phycisphaerales bacterium]